MNFLGCSQDDIDPQSLHRVYPAEVFFLLWQQSRLWDLQPLLPNHSFIYIVIKEVELHDTENRIQYYNWALPFELCTSHVETIGCFPDPYSANEFAMIRFERLNALLRGQFIPRSSVEHHVKHGCVRLSATFNTNSSYKVHVERRLLFIRPRAQRIGTGVNSGVANA
ncbi:hypothetical protein E0Z10_g2914 [Xylaria hypoxylon]|uniref:Uncharacterized protein n=1 Tax=Xylaria hypoxylon TaxID=37992 RepID=A0A4Z0Z344_9PEZI|nr:hypothetical protein E0Z10_g2914 [Xylaria hypoxylon]